ncbi:hypothetical protein V5O48_017805, partial [Marasmius crinis-equi]
TNVAALNKLNLDGFFANVKEHFLPYCWAAQWAADIANTAQGELFFKCPKQLPVPTLINHLTANMTKWLQEALLDKSENSVASHSLAVKLCKGTAKAKKGETFDAWISLVNKVERVYTTQFQIFQSMLSHTASDTGIESSSEPYQISPNTAITTTFNYSRHQHALATPENCSHQHFLISDPQQDSSESLELLSILGTLLTILHLSQSLTKPLECHGQALHGFAASFATHFTSFRLVNIGVNQQSELLMHQQDQSEPWFFIQVTL